jgi:hypothetical protein
MTGGHWNGTATGLARHVRQNWVGVARGAVPVRVIDETTEPAHYIDEESVIVGVFGNDNYLADKRTRNEVDLIRRHLPEAGAHELGFGTSQDGYSWAILVEADSHTFHTEAGKKFQREMLRLTLGELVATAWQSACGRESEPVT